MISSKYVAYFKKVHSHLLLFILLIIHECINAILAGIPDIISLLCSGIIDSSDTIDEITWLVESRIIEPLELFGIVECSYKEKVKNYLVIDKVKKTELFDKFMKFEV